MRDQSSIAATGDPVLDRMLQGGLPRERAVLLTGGPGTGKSTLAMQFLQTGLADDERCLFVTTEQTREELHDSFADFAFDLSHPELAIATLHATPEPDADRDGNRRLRLRTLEGGSPVDEQHVPFTVENVARFLRSAGECDRLAFDSVSALSVLTEDGELLRRGVLELVRTFTDELGATTVFTAEGDEQGRTETALEFATHGVIRLTREEVRDDPHRFLRIDKLRGADHDHRTVEFELDGDGVTVGPARRSQPPELKTHRHTPIGVPGLDELCGGGLATGAGVLLRHDGHANLTALFSQVLSRTIERGYAVMLVPTIRMRPSSTRSLLAGHEESLDDLLADDRLFVLDMIGAWDETRRNVFGARESAGAIRSVLDAIRERTGETPRLSLINADAMVNGLGEEDARTVRYDIESNWLRPEDLMLNIHNPAVTSDTVDGFLTNAAEQVLDTWVTDEGLQYVSLAKSPCGFVGTTSLVEYTTEPPYLSVQDPPESRENPYAVDGSAGDGNGAGTDPG